MMGTNVAHAQQCSSIAEIACGTDGFGTLCAAVQAAGLAETLSGPGPFTVFAPTDTAFGNLPAGTVEGLLNDIPTLTSILLFHAAGMSLFSNNLRCNSQVKMLNGGVSETVCQRVGQKFQSGPGNAGGMLPEITSANIQACNGVVHVVSEVMLP